jgi:hypothetical protein
MVVHFLRIGTVKPLHVRGDAFAKVGFEAVNAISTRPFSLLAYHSQACGLVKS